MMDLIPAESFHGCVIADTEGNVLGNGETLVVDLVRGQLAVAVISFQGRLIGIPWALIQPPGVPDRPGGKAEFTAKTDESLLEGAPDFGRESGLVSPNWKRWSHKVFEHFHLEDPWAEPEGPGAALDVPPGS